MNPCPVCATAWGEATPACSCGYDFTTRSPARAIQRFTREARRANLVWWRGLLAMICLPVTLFGIGSLTIALLLTMVQLGLAAVWIVQGLVRADAANKKLAAAKELVQLAPARLIER